MEEGETSNLAYNLLYCLHLPAALYYSLVLANDHTSNLIFLLTLLTLTSVFKQYQRKVLVFQAAATLADFALKAASCLGIWTVSTDPAVMDSRIVEGIFQLSADAVGIPTLVYVGMLVVSWALPWAFRAEEEESRQSLEYYMFLKTISNLLDFITPVLIYALGFTKLSSKSFREWVEQLGPELYLSNFDMFEQVAWSLITALFLILHKNKPYLRKILTMMILVLIIRDHHIKIYYPEINLYNLKASYINAIKILIVLFFRIHNQTSHIRERELSEYEDREKSRESSYKRFTLKRKLTLKTDRNHLNIMLLLLFTIATLILTNGIGNIVAIIAVFINLPNYDEKSFRTCIGLGVTASFLLQPNQFIYFLFLYVARYISTHDHVFEKKNWWMFIELGRIIILLSKVSVLNFLIGLFQSQFLVIFTIMFRTACSFFKYILVFMGTEDNYEYYVEYFVPSSIATDILLWIHFIFLKMYSPASTHKFKGTDITNIFKEYSIINYFERGLKILKVFHWIAYIVISLMILNSKPSLFTLLRVTPLLLAFVIGIFESHRSEWTQRIWTWNFYTSFSIAFVKYFYLLSKYENLSPWLVTMLEPLIQNHEFIGLSPPDLTYLWISFAPDFFVIIVNAIVLFLFKIELSEVNYNLQKERIFLEAHLETKLLEVEEEKDKNIHYLYKNYIKSIEFKFKETSKFRPFLTDFIVDLCLLCFLAVFYLFPHGQYPINEFSYFLIFFIGYLKQNGKHNWKHLFRLLIGISSVDLLILYVTYFLAMIIGTSNDYNLAVIMSKYILLALAVIFNETNEALMKFYSENKIIKKNQYEFLVFKMIAPIIPNQKMKKEVLVLYIHLFKALAYAFYFTELILGNSEIQYIQLGGMAAFGVLAVLVTNIKELYKTYWIYCMMGAIFAALWQGYFETIVCLIFIRAQSMLLEQFNLISFVEKYGVTNKTSNDEMKKRVEEVEFRFGTENRLEAISEVKEVQKASYMSFGEEQIIWRQQNGYVTVVWILPLLSLILVILGVLFYQAGPFSFVLFVSALSGILYCLVKFEQWSIASAFPAQIMKAIAVIMALLAVDHLYLQIFTSDHSSVRNNIGMFLILAGLFGYYYLSQYSDSKHSSKEYQYAYLIDFSAKRSQEAINYWKKKCDIVSELGSQIHNQKKISSLKKLFQNKENLRLKVEHLTQELKENCSHRKSRFANLEKIQDFEDDKNVFKKQEFQVYSNMLTFMSLEDLQYCYINLNQYCKGDFAADSDITQTTSQLRVWVLQNFQNTFCDTLSKWERQRYYAALKRDQRFATLEKIEEEIERAEAEEEIYEQFGEEHENGQAQQKSEMSSKRRPHPVSREKERQHESSFQLSDMHPDSLNLAAKYSADCRSVDLNYAKDYCSERIDMRLGELSWFARKIVQNIEILGLIVTAGWNFFGGVYTIPTNIAIFSWAIVLETKTTVIFWMFLLIYTSVILGCKLLLAYLPKHFFINFLFYYNPNGYFYEFVLVFVCAVEIIFLKLGGTSEIGYSQRENIFDAFYRNILNQSSKGQRKSKEFQFLEIYKKLKCEIKYSFFYRVFSKGRLKPGKDLYPMLAIVQVIILLYIFFFYDMMEFESKNNRKSLGEILTVTQFSKNMIVALFFQALIMVADRIIVSLNLIDSLNQKLQNFFINMAFSNELKYEPLSLNQVQKLNTFDYLLILKYIFHVLLLIAFNFFVYFYIPSGGLQKSIIPECENTVCGKSYTFLSIFLLLYLVYFVISGLQIKHGFNRNKCRNTLMERYNWIDYYIYMCFTGIPFLWEFKKISDWTITATALPLFHYMKFEDINARMYQSKCESQILKIKPLGQGPWYKYFMGPPGFIFILCLVFSPIIMYSSFNPFAVQDNILAASFKFQLVMDKYTFYNFFETSHTNIISDQSLQGYNQKILGFFDRANLYKIEASSYPDQVFMLSEPAVQQLSDHIRKTFQKQINHQFQLKLVASVTEKEGGETTIEWGSKFLNHKELLDLDNTIHNNGTLQISNFYSPFPGELSNQSIYLTNRINGEYFQLETPRLKKELDPKSLTKKGLFIFYKSSVKYKVAFGLLTFYLTYVVLINSLFRMYLTGGLENIIFQGCELQKILFICEAVRSARILQNFYQEQYLYFSLVDLMRYPRMIKDIADDFSNLRKDQKQIKEE